MDTYKWPWACQVKSIFHRQLKHKILTARPKMRLLKDMLFLGVACSPCLVVVWGPQRQHLVRWRARCQMLVVIVCPLLPPSYQQWPYYTSEASFANLGIYSNDSEQPLLEEGLLGRDDGFSYPQTLFDLKGLIVKCLPAWFLWVAQKNNAKCLFCIFLSAVAHCLAMFTALYGIKWRFQGSSQYCMDTGIRTLYC